MTSTARTIRKIALPSPASQPVDHVADSRDDTGDAHPFVRRLFCIGVHHQVDLPVVAVQGLVDCRSARARHVARADRPAARAPRAGVRGAVWIVPARPGKCRHRLVSLTTHHRNPYATIRIVTAVVTARTMGLERADETLFT